tara:strand:+ start:50 stop:487 length:438 start_codon:yes stop_codon:yes gene_type:complete
MKLIGKIRQNFLNQKNSFNVGFNNRSPFSYITSTGVGQPTVNDPGMKSFEPDDWAKAYDTSKAVRAETEMYKEAGEAAGRAGSMIIGAVVGGDAGQDMVENQSVFKEKGKMKKNIELPEGINQEGLLKFMKENDMTYEEVMEKYF